MEINESPSETARRVLERPATREVVPHVAGESFRWNEHDYPSPIARWNYHPEVEIHLIRRSTGSYIIGNQIGPFAAGHIAVVGPNIAHDWMSDLTPGEQIQNRDAVIQFTLDWLERAIVAVPELSDARSVIEDSLRGVVYSGATARHAAVEIEAVGVTSGLRRMAHLCSLLQIFVQAPLEERHFVAHELYAAGVSRQGKEAVEAGLAYVLENLRGDIRMSEAAKLAHMSEPSFSKYFKNASGMTFTDLVRNLRIASACRLLVDSDSTISAISAVVGYNTLANFNRQFLARTGITPRQYRALSPDCRPIVGATAGLTKKPVESS